MSNNELNKNNMLKYFRLAVKMVGNVNRLIRKTSFFFYDNNLLVLLVVIFFLSANKFVTASVKQQILYGFI